MARPKTDTINHQTTALLQKIRAGSMTTDDITGLKDVLRFHENRYYILNDPLISDFEYDQLYKCLESLEAENPDLVTPDSPTQRVGKSLTKEFPTVQHLVPMLSLQNSYNSDDLEDFDRKARELTGMAEIEYCVEPKFDGASISLVYEDDKLVRGATRGDGPTSGKSGPSRSRQNFRNMACKPSRSGVRYSSIKQISSSSMLRWPNRAFPRCPTRATRQQVPCASRIPSS